MGIPKFNSWFHAAHAPAYVRLDGSEGPGTNGADHVYVDMNSVLHSALRQVRMEREGERERSCGAWRSLKTKKGGRKKTKKGGRKKTYTRALSKAALFAHGPSRLPYFPRPPSPNDTNQ
jgi:uncharacterized protein (DUF927 family)